ncbi:hypothetical protein ABW20_dc0107782 [Dactylellina cionopaga]|nr:hypothetical protein ABW20_dc0107782 [Dactylellina cionopaga]
MSKLSKPKRISSAATLDVDIKRRPSLLRKESKGRESQIESKKQNRDDDNPPFKRRFSLKDAIRRVLSRKQTKGNDFNPGQSQQKDEPLIVQQSLTGELKNPPSEDLGRQPDEIPTNENHPIINEAPPARSYLPNRLLSISSVSSVSSLSNDSLKATSPALLSPRPTERLGRRDPSDHKVSNSGFLFEQDVSIWFEGAPIFYIDESRGKYGEPSVRYSKQVSRALSSSALSCEDAKSLNHNAFQDYSNRGSREISKTELQHHWLNGPTETPSMASFFGHEPGSTGWQYFLESQMADFELQQGSFCGEIDEYGLEFQPPDAIGVRSIDSTTMVDRLRDIGKFHAQSYRLEKDLDVEARALYGQLFTRLLYPARRNSETINPKELKLLYQYLPQNLELESLYFTSKVNWDLVIARKWLTNVRIVEQPFTPDFDMLTPVPPPPQSNSGWHRFFLADEVNIEEAEEPQDADTYDAFFVSQHPERQLDGLLHFARKIDWPGIEILEGVIRDKLRDPTGLHTPGSFVSYKGPTHSPGKLTPRSFNGTAGSSYFGYFTNKHTSSAIVRNMGQGGWLSRTYIAGLILPGEGLSHLLMGSLLESDTLALNEIGEQGSMYGGIIRRTLESSESTASWWSMNNIVGRVLATDTSQGYAGWIGKCVGRYSGKGITDEDLTILSAVAAKLMRNFTLAGPQKKMAKLAEPTGWVDVITNQRSMAPKNPRLSTPESVELDSGLLGENLLSGCRVPVEEFQFPETLPFQSIEIEVLGLRFWDREGLTSINRSERGLNSSKDKGVPDELVPAYQVEIVFRVPGVDPLTTHHFDSVDSDIVGLLLGYDAYFVTSYPCHGQNRESLALEEVLSKPDFTPRTTHPVHSSHKYKVVDITDLQSHYPIRRGGSKDEDCFITVINAKGIGQGLYVYAKAWCAKWGVDAIISQSNRTCLSCAIREAYAIAVDVVIDR